MKTKNGSGALSIAGISKNRPKSVKAAKSPSKQSANHDGLLSLSEAMRAKNDGNKDELRLRRIRKLPEGEMKINRSWSFLSLATMSSVRRMMGQMIPPSLRKPHVYREFDRREQIKGSTVCCQLLVVVAGSVP